MSHQLPFIVFVVVMVICRIKMLKANKLLTVEEKAKLVDAGSRVWPYLIVSGIIFGGLAIIYGLKSYSAHFFADPVHFLSLMIVWIIAMLAAGIWMRITSYRRLKSAGLPKHYLKTVAIYSSAIQIAAVILLISVFIFNS